MTPFSRFFAPSIRRRILAGFVIVALLVLAMAAATFFQLSQVRTFSEQIIPDSSQMGYLQSLGLATSALDADLERFLVIRGAEYHDSVLQDLTDMTSALDNMQRTAGTAALPTVQNLQGIVARLQPEVSALLEAGTGSLTTDVNQQIVAMYADIDQMKQLQQTLSADTLTQLQATARAQGRITSDVITQTVILGLVVFAIAVAASLVINRTMRPIGALTETATAIAAGDLSRTAPVQSQDEIGTLATAFNQMTGQLRGLIGGLEQRVAERTRALATSTEVSRRLSTILDRDQLVREVVQQMQSAFGYYHTQIYLADPTGKSLVMAGGTGEAGAAMVARGHSLPKGKGLVGRAAETNTVVLVSDIAANSEWLPNPLLPETKSELAVPIAVGDQVIGVLDVQHNIVGGLQQQDADLIQSIANQVAIALQNIQSTEIITKRATELQTVAAISTAAATISDVQKMLESVVHLTQRRFGLYHAHVFTYNENTSELQIVACGWKEGDVHEGTHGTTTIPLGQEQSLVARAARDRQAVIVNDVRSDPSWLPNPLLPDTASEMAVPMIVGDQILGVLDVQSERLNAFTEEDANIQATLASQVATALQNARSFSLTQRQAQRETAINLITQKIQSATSIDAALQIAARELGHVLGMKQTLVTLDPETLAGDHKSN